MRTIADGNEVLRFVTRVLRGQEDDVTLKDKIKAAELLGKRYDLFADGAESASGSVTIVDDVAAQA